MHWTVRASGRTDLCSVRAELVEAAHVHHGTSTGSVRTGVLVEDHGGEASGVGGMNGTCPPMPEARSLRPPHNRGMTTDETRPDPDALLQQLREQEAREARGRLRIYFGSSAGVGKTYSMLTAARQLKANGVDIVAGIVETHGRAETAALLQGLELLPPAQIEARGRTLPEF